MKRIKQTICMLLAAGLLTSCTNTPHEKPDTQTVDNSARDALFADRVKTPRVVTETVGDVRYTVTFDREEYYLGDDIAFSVCAENIGAEAMTIRYNLFLDAGAAIHGRMLRQNGAELSSNVMRRQMELAGMEDTAEWLPGERLEQEGFFSTTISSVTSTPSQVLVLEVNIVDHEFLLSVDIPLHTVLPDDRELLPYLESGMIDEQLYHRARSMADDESVVIMSSSDVPFKKYLPGESADTHPTWHSGNTLLNGQYYTRITRQQLITALENGYPMKLSYNLMIYPWFWTYPGAEI